MAESSTDDAILSVVGARWVKVAMVLAKAAESMGLGHEDEHWKMISARVEVLVKDGRLEAQGNTRNWRASEVRLAQS